MNFSGFVVGSVMLLTIAFTHVLVIKGEYHFGTKWWPVLFSIGFLFILVSIFVDNKLLSGSLGIVSFCLFWSIYELFLQKKRVAKGWFPRNPKRDYDIG